MKKNHFLYLLQTAHANGIFSQFIKDNAKSGVLFEILVDLQGLDKIEQDPRWHPEGDVWTHTLLVIENLPENATFSMSLCALFHDVGKATTTKILENGRITAFGHENASKKIADKMLDILGAEDQLKQEVLFLVARHMIAHSKDANIKTLKRLIKEASFDLVDQLLLHGVADVKGGSNDLTDCNRLRSLFNTLDPSDFS